MQADKIKQYIVDKDEEGVTFNVNVSDKDIYCAGVKVLEIGMYVGTVNDEGFYGDGDMYVTWDMEGLRNDETARTAGMLLLRNIHSDDDVTAVMGQFYWEHMFDDDLRSILADCGFSADAVSAVHTSEWGMQDEGRASYDAYDIADEVRKAIAD